MMIKVMMGEYNTLQIKQIPKSKLNKNQIQNQCIHSSSDNNAFLNSLDGFFEIFLINLINLRSVNISSSILKCDVLVECC